VGFELHGSVSQPTPRVASRRGALAPISPVRATGTVSDALPARAVDAADRLEGGRGGAHVHPAFHVPDPEIDRLVDRIRERGGEFEGPVQLGPRRTICLTDADGNVSSSGPRTWPRTRRGARAGAGSGPFCST
jgi:hypothetical protein